MSSGLYQLYVTILEFIGMSYAQLWQNPTVTLHALNYYLRFIFRIHRVPEKVRKWL